MLLKIGNAIELYGADSVAVSDSYGIAILNDIHFAVDQIVIYSSRIRTLTPVLKYHDAVLK